jgi:uncharacterized membrane protein (DUF485 family)
MKSLMRFLAVIVFMFVASFAALAADPIADLITEVSATWGLVLAAGVIILGALLGVAVVKRIKRFL